MTKRRHFTPEFKAWLVLDILAGVQSQAEACRKHGLSPNRLALWKSTCREPAHTVFESDATRTTEQVRIAEREQVLGRMTLENEILKKSRAGGPDPQAETRDDVVVA
jgi:transposase-like protein